jgi:HSP20 family molecular chaperone IbpA
MDDPQKSSTRDRDYARLPPLLKRLVNALERIAKDDSLPAVPSSAAPERWEDESYIYLEFDLPGVLGSELEVGIHEGRAYIRIER